MQKESPVTGPRQEYLVSGHKLCPTTWVNTVATILKSLSTIWRSDGSRWIPIGLVGLLAIGGLFPGCGISKAYHQDDLRAAAARHHVNLRWGRIPNAASALHPDLQAAFIQDWETRTQQVEIKDIEIVDLFIHEDQSQAVIQMEITYLTKDTLVMNSYSTSEKWRFVNERWTIVQPAAVPTIR